MHCVCYHFTCIGRDVEEEMVMPKMVSRRKGVACVLYQSRYLGGHVARVVKNVDDIHLYHSHTLSPLRYYDKATQLDEDVEL